MFQEMYKAASKIDTVILLNYHQQLILQKVLFAWSLFISVSLIFRYYYYNSNRTFSLSLMNNVHRQ